MAHLKIYKPKKDNVVKLMVYLNSIKNGGKKDK